ncbi:hypothetical protein B0J14DRAFT_671427 [Halenospora varia]|nr:hypothetical protein B0J14DRAFT_671427 [Halenospora varia]
MQVLPFHQFQKIELTQTQWIWRCHLCHRVYRLGVTRRCLDDGHYFCSISEGESTYAITKADGTKITKVRRSCASEFDYSAWGIYNIWRREVRLHKIARLKKTALRNSMVENSRTDEKQKLRKERNAALAGRWRGSIGNALERWGERDCWKDCDFPSECHNFRLLALREKRRRALREAQDDELWRDVYDAEVGSESSSESENENDEWDEEEKEEGEDGEKLSEFFDFEGRRPMRCWRKGILLSMLAQAAAELSAAGSSEFGNIEGNVEALNEASAAAAFASSKRRRSINALASGDISDLEPGSPLKESMDIDSDIPWDSGTDSGGKKEEAKEKSAFR